MVNSFFFPLYYITVVMFQVSAPVELPAMTLPPKQETSKTATFTPASANFKIPITTQKTPVASNPVSASGSESRVSTSAAAPLVDDADEELDRLLGLDKAASGNQSVSVADEKSDSPEKGEFVQGNLKICEYIYYVAQNIIVVGKLLFIFKPLL